MRSGIPWSVKGIEPEAREAAKQAARRSGLTLGAWLNQVIMDSGTDEVAGEETTAPERDLISLTSNEATGLRDPLSDTDSVRQVADRLSQSERRTAELARKLEQSLSQIAQRIDAATQPVNDEPHEADPGLLAPLERKIAQLAERLEASERQRIASQTSRRPDDKAIATLERSVSAVVDHLEASEKRHEESLEDIRHALGQLQNRFAEAEEASAREEAEARSRELQSNLNTLASRLERMEQSFTGIGSTLEKTQSQAVDAALKAIAERADADGQKNLVNQLQQNLGMLTQRLAKAEERSDETLRQFERSMESVARKLDSIDKPRPDVTPAIVKAVESRLEQMAARLDKNEKMTVEAAQALEKAIAGISQGLQTSESRSKQTVETLQQLMQRMADKIARVEKQAKATQASPMLSPQIGVGPGHNGGPGLGFMPAGQGFPVPNFDSAPVMGGIGFGEPTLRQDFRSPRPEPVAAWTPPPAGMEPAPRRVAPVPPIDDAPPPPPFAEPAEDGAEDDVAFDAEESNVSDAQVQGAHDFLAAARRAAQMAAANGQNGPYFGPGAQSPYVDAAARPGAYGRDEEERPSKRLIGAASAMIIAALGVGGYFALADKTPAPQQTLVAPPVESTMPTPVPETSLTPLVSPEATPDEAGATTVAPALPVTPEGDTKPATPKPVAKPAAKPAASSKPKSSEAGMGTLTPGPKLTPHPAKPVETSPLPGAKPDLAAAAAAGNAAAQYQLGLDLATGDAGPSDMAKAAGWYRKAADQGMAAAQYRLAALYEKGRGVAQDNKAAMSWYAKAAEGGNVKAMHNLAVIHAEGRGTKQDFALAAKWFAAAAEYGLGDSQYNLAILNERGLGTQANPVEAYKWFSVAAKGGDSGAARKRDELAAHMEPAALAQAKVAAETYRARRPEPVANGDISGLTNWK